MYSIPPSLPSPSNDLYGANKQGSDSVTVHLPDAPSEVSSGTSRSVTLPAVTPPDASNNGDIESLALDDAQRQNLSFYAKALENAPEGWLQVCGAVLAIIAGPIESGLDCKNPTVQINMLTLILALSGNAIDAVIDGAGAFDLPPNLGVAYESLKKHSKTGVLKFTLTGLLCAAAMFKKVNTIQSKTALVIENPTMAQGVGWMLGTIISLTVPMRPIFAAGQMSETVDRVKQNPYAVWVESMAAVAVMACCYFEYSMMAWYNPWNSTQQNCLVEHVVQMLLDTVMIGSDVVLTQAVLAKLLYRVKAGVAQVCKKRQQSLNELEGQPLLGSSEGSSAVSVPEQRSSGRCTAGNVVMKGVSIAVLGLAATGHILTAFQEKALDESMDFGTNSTFGALCTEWAHKEGAVGIWPHTVFIMLTTLVAYGEIGDVALALLGMLLKGGKKISQANAVFWMMLLDCCVKRSPALEDSE